MELKTMMILGIPIHDIDEVNLLLRLREWLLGKEQKLVVTPNPEFMLLAQKDAHFRDILKQADLSLPDGVGLRFAAAALTDTYLHFRHTGVDTLERLAKLCEETGKKMLLFGGEKGREQTTAQCLQKTYPRLKIKAIDPGKIIFDDPIRPEIVSFIQAYEPDMMAVALGGREGKQEKFMYHHLKKFPSVKIMIGVGGAFDMMSGVLTRAPKWMRQSGLEWMWRLYLEPRRFRRILRAAIVFPILVAWDTLKSGRFFKVLPRVFLEVFRQIKQ